MAARKTSGLMLFEEGGSERGAAGGQGDEIITEAELTHELSERRLFTKRERNVIKDVLWGLHG